MRNGAPAKAREQFSLACRLDASDAACPRDLGLSYAAESKWEEAEQALESSLKMNPDFAPALKDLTKVWLRRNQRAKAVSRVESFLATRPSDPAGFMILGSLHLSAKDYGKAQIAFERASAMNPKLLDAHLRLGQIEQERGNSDRAIERYEAALSLEPGSAPIGALLGNLYLSRGRVEQARTCYRKVIAMNPNFAVAAGNLAWLEAENGGDLNTALTLAQRARELMPDHVPITDTLAWIHYKKGVYASAIPLLKECVSKTPDSPLYRYHLGMALLSAGERGGARMQLETALRLRLDGQDAEHSRRALEGLRR
jgi:tetratricopeptide (TPR) repeat protein